MASALINHFRDQGSDGVGFETAPRGILLVVAVGDAYRVSVGDEPASPTEGGFLIGPQSRFGTSALSGAAEGVQVSLTWSNAATVFGPVLPELADQALPVSALDGGSRLADQLSEVPAAEQVRLVVSWLRDRSLTHREPSALVVRALGRIEAGASSVESLAAELDCSRGHLHRIVRAATGQSPTTLMRIVRLHRVLAPREGQTLADRAAAMGYADHAHLCHDTRRLSGRTPSELFDAQVT